MRRLIPLCLILTLTLTLILSACTPTKGFDGGRPITREDLESMSSACFPDGDSADESSPVYTDREPNTYYWTDGGTVYHKYRDCIHLKNVRSIRSGSLISARADGRSKGCSSCCGE